MSVFLDYLSGILLFAGVIVCLIGAIGVFKLPDVFSRMHGSGVIDTFGVGSIFLGLMIQAGFSIICLKLLLILIFIFFTSPTATHALARAASNSLVVPKVKDEGITIPIDKH